MQRNKANYSSSANDPNANWRRVLSKADGFSRRPCPVAGIVTKVPPYAALYFSALDSGIKSQAPRMVIAGRRVAASTEIEGFKPLSSLASMRLGYRLPPVTAVGGAAVEPLHTIRPSSAPLFRSASNSLPAASCDRVASAAAPCRSISRAARLSVSLASVLESLVTR